MRRGKVTSAMAGLLACVLIIGGAGLGAVASGTENVSYATGSLNGKTMQLVFVDMGGELTAGIALSNGNVTSAKAAGALLNEEAEVRGMQAVAAINGGSFCSDYDDSAPASFPDNYPCIYGTLLKDGQLINGGSSEKTATIGFTSDGQALIDRVSITSKVSFGDQSITPWAVNAYNEDPSAILLFTSEMVLPVTCHPDARLLVIKNGVISEVRPGGTFTVMPGTEVLLYNEASAARAINLGRLPEEGTAVSVTTQITAEQTASRDAWQTVTDALGCGPALLLNSKNVVGEDAVSDESQLPDAVSQKSFAAIIRDGRLLLGSCVASNQDLATFLSRLGAVDALCLGGGSSSMLYTAEDGYLQVALSKLPAMLIFLEEDDSHAGSVVHTALPTASPVYVNKHQIRPDSYNINGNNYFKLRDLAYVLNATNKRFEVTWDGPRNAITLTSGEYYTLVGGEMAPKDTEVKEARASQSRIYLDGETIRLTAYLIEGNNYFKLRDLGKALDFGVTWDPKASAVLINTNESYHE